MADAFITFGKKSLKAESGAKGDLPHVYNRVKLNKDHFLKSSLKITRSSSADAQPTQDSKTK